MNKKLGYLLFLSLVMILLNCNKSENLVDYNKKMNDSITLFNKLLKIHSASLSTNNIKEKNKSLDSLIEHLEKKKLAYPLLMSYVAYASHGSPEKNLQRLKKAEQIATKTNDKRIKAISYFLKAKYFHVNNNRKEAFKNALMANALSKNIDDAIYDNSLSILGDITFESGDFDTACNYYNIILQRGKKRKINAIYTTEDYLLLSLSYARNGDLLRTKKYLDSAKTIIDSNKYQNAYLYNMVLGYVAASQGHYKNAIKYYDKELQLMGYYNLLYIKKAEAFHQLGLKDSVKKNLAIVENSNEKNNIINDFDGLKEYYPLKIKYSDNTLKDSLMNNYASLMKKILAENKSTIILKQKNELDNIVKEKEHLVKIETEKRKQYVLLTAAVILLLIVLVVFFFYQNRNNVLKLKLIESQYQASKKERKRIYQELHDDLGSHFTIIAMAKELMKSKENKETSREIDLIIDNSTFLYSKIKEIIWSMDIKNDTLYNFIQYIDQYLSEIFEPLKINLKIFHSKIVNHDTILDAYYRRQILLAIKEISNNAIKYSEATEFTFSFDFDKNYIYFLISDNGKGFDYSTCKKGKGIQNILALGDRIDQCMVDFDSSEKGTYYKLILKLSNHVKNSHY